MTAKNGYSELEAKLLYYAGENARLRRELGRVPRVIRWLINLLWLGR